MSTYDYQGKITIALKSLDESIFGCGDLTDACLDVSGLHVKLIFYSNPATREQFPFNNPNFRRILQEHGVDKHPFFLAFLSHVTDFIESIELFNVVSDYILSPYQENRVLTNKDNLQVWCDWDNPSLTHNLYYAFNREKSGKFGITDMYIDFLKRSGPQGKKFAVVLKKYTAIEEQELWASATLKDKSPLWLDLLLNSFIKDRYLTQKKAQTQQRAIPREHFDKALKKFFQAPKPIITVGENRVDYHKEGDNKSLGFIPTDMVNFPNAHPSRIPIIKAGGELFNSFLSHKLLNWENKLFYERWKDEKIRLKENYARISVKGGYKQLVQMLGSYPDGETIDKLRKLLHFQAHFLFAIPEGNGGCRIGNLIALEEKVNKFGKVGELKITAGSMLTPEAVFSCGVRDYGRLLVPFVNLPEKMIGNPVTWGSQAFLQMLTLEYITLNSRQFAKNGSVKISTEQWEKLAIEAGLSSKFLTRIHDIVTLFCCPEQGFLEVQGTEYSFNKKNTTAKIHLIEQGKIREKQAKNAGRRKSKKRD